MNEYIYTPEDAMRALDAPLLGVFPHVGEKFDLAISGGLWKRLCICFSLLFRGRAEVCRRG